MALSEEDVIHNEEKIAEEDEDQRIEELEIRTVTQEELKELRLG